MTTIVIMPGGFHPFHAGHAALYQSAQRAFPDAEVFIAATNDTSSRPFPFAVKEKLAKLAGVEAGHFVQVKSPFRAEEITAGFDPARDILIFVRSEKDSTKPPQPGGVKKDGSPSYLQPLLGAKRLEPFAKHAYMAYLPTVEFGPGMTSATEIRGAWPTLNEKRKTALVMSLYPATQKNIKLAATVVKMLDAAIGSEGVAEAFDKPYRSKTEKSETGSFDVLAKLPDGTNLSIMFNNEGNDEWQVEFYRNNSQEVTGEGDAQRIFATVLNAIQKFITKHKPAHLTFAASKETDPTVYYEPGEPQPNPASRAKLYDRLVQRYAKAWGYRAFRADNGKVVIYELSRINKQGVAEGTDGWIGNPAKWKEAVLQAHGNDVVFKNYSHPGQPGKRSVHAWDVNGKIVGVYQRHNKMGMVQPNIQGVAEGLDEAVGGNYLYHATGANGLSSILQSGYIKSADGPQKATQAQTALPTVSVTRDWGYASGSSAQSQDGGIGRDAILIIDRNALESNYKTISTSQSRDIRGMPRASEPGLSGALTVRKAVVKPGVELKGQHKMSYGTAKAGGEFEEAVVVPKGVLPLKGTMVGFWVNPKSELMKDPTIMNDPRRLDMVRPNQFVRAKQAQGVAEAAKKCPPATQDIGINLENRQKAIDEYGYGPLNPDLPNTKFWMKKVDEWNLDSMEEAQQSLCGNCAAFDVRQDTLDCIAQGIDSESPEDAEGVIDAGDLGYCKFLKFKCASRRTCDAWVTGGPLQDKPVDENQGWAATYNESSDYIEEKWSGEYKSSIDCAAPKGFSQKAHCAGRKK